MADMIEFLSENGISDQEKQLENPKKSQQLKKKSEGKMEHSQNVVDNANPLIPFTKNIRLGRIKYDRQENFQPTAERIKQDLHKTIEPILRKNILKEPGAILRSVDLVYLSRFNTVKILQSPYILLQILFKVNEERRNAGTMHTSETQDVRLLAPVQANKDFSLGECVPIALRHYFREILGYDFHHDGFKILMALVKLQYIRPKYPILQEIESLFDSRTELTQKEVEEAWRSSPEFENYPLKVPESETKLDFESWTHEKTLLYSEVVLKALMPHMVIGKVMGSDVNCNVWFQNYCHLQIEPTEQNLIRLFEELGPVLIFNTSHIKLLVDIKLVHSRFSTNSFKEFHIHDSLSSETKYTFESSSFTVNGRGNYDLVNKNWEGAYIHVETKEAYARRMTAIKDAELEEQISNDAYTFSPRDVYE